MDTEMTKVVESDPREQLESFRQNDAYRQLLSFTESLVTKVVNLSTQLEQVTGDLEDQNAIRRDWKRRAEAAESEISESPFILALIDGDGYIFQDHFLQDAESGGRDAAHCLLSKVKNAVKAAQLPTLSSDHQIMVNVYANKRGLTAALMEAGIISRPNDLEGFFCKFTQSQSQFHFVDCGPGREGVDAKIRDTYRFFLQNCQCKLIFLALCHDGGYISELDKYRNDPVAKRKTWLVDHYGKSRDFIDPPFPVVTFDDVFRMGPLPLKRLNTSASLANNSSYSSALTSFSTTEQTAKSEQRPFFMHPTKPWPISDVLSPKNMAQVSQHKLAKDSQTSYLAPGTEPPHSVDQIAVNGSNQRIDAPLRTPFPGEQRRFEDRIAYRKLCNEYYLRGHCPDLHCRFDHSHIDKELKSTLRYTARTVVCRSGTACRRANCYYGHQCPFTNCDSRRCPFAKAGLHDVKDLKIVRFVSPAG